MTIQRAIFAPFSIGVGILAGVVARKVFHVVWGRIDDRDPPKPDDRAARWGKMIFALAIQGAIFKATRGVVDRFARQGFGRATGVWPGDERPDRA